MNWRLILEVAPAMLFALFVLAPKLTRSIFFEALSHPLRESAILVKDGRILVVHR